MKELIIVSLLITSTFCFGQRVELFIDSLTHNSSRTWIDVNGSNFTEIGSNCNYGIEVTFIKQGDKVIFHQCSEGVWKAFEYTFKVTSINGEHFVELYENDIKLNDYEFEVQMVAESGKGYITELTLFYFKSKTSYTLKSQS